MVFENDSKCKASNIVEMLDSGKALPANELIQECSDKLFQDTGLHLKSAHQRNVDYLKEVDNLDQKGVGADINLVYQRWTALKQFPPTVTSYFIKQ